MPRLAHRPRLRIGFVVALVVPVMSVAVAQRVLERRGDADADADADAVVGVVVGSAQPTERGTVFASVDLTLLGSPGTLTPGASGRPTIVNLFASTCVPCRTELPALAEFAARHPGVDVVAVGTDRSPADSAAFLAEVAPTLVGLSDREGVAARQWRVLTLPTTVFVRADGTEVARAIGALDEDELSRSVARWFDATVTTADSWPPAQP
jgi:thiol-disulfide isomerase/thioredoxin